MFKEIIIILIVFLLGVLSTQIYADVTNQQPITIKSLDLNKNDSIEVKYPQDWVKEKQIEVYSNRVILDIKNAEWASFTDTHSMEPVLGYTSNAIEVVPQSEDDIQVGDIVSYESEYTSGIIIHRVVYRGNDEKGIYFVMKGDNNPTSDPGKVRFSQIKRVVVAVIY